MTARLRHGKNCTAEVPGDAVGKIYFQKFQRIGEAVMGAAGEIDAGDGTAVGDDAFRSVIERRYDTLSYALRDILGDALRDA